MAMNISKIKCALIALAGVTLAACDEVDQDNRTHYVPPVTPETVSKGVLIEDFTGQACINCPAATDKIHELQELYGDNVVAVGIHSGPFSKRPPLYTNKYPLWTATGDEYYNYWKISSQPKGIVNRTGGEMLYQNWSEAVIKGLQMEASLKITVDNKYDAATKKLVINTSLKSMNDTPVSGKLQLWIIQDSIEGYQLFPNGVSNREYVHNHVFRYAVNGAWGEDVAVPAGEMVNVTTETVLDDSHIEQNIKAPEFVPENMWVVAFVYNGSGVENVVKARVVSAADE